MSTSVQIAKTITIAGLIIILLIAIGYAWNAFVRFGATHPYVLIGGGIGIWLSAVFWYLIHSMKLMGGSHGD
jgi:predicted acyltransferase